MRALNPTVLPGRPWIEDHVPLGVFGRCPVRWRLPGCGGHRAFRLLLSALMVVITPALSASEQQSPKQRFADNALIGWERLKQSTSEIAGLARRTYEVQITDKSDPQFGKPVVRNSELHFSIDNGSARIQVDDKDKNGNRRRTIFGANPEYSFTAAQSSPDGPYFIKSCGRDTETVDSIRKTIEILVASDLHASFGVDTDLRTLPELMKSDGWTVHHCADVSLDGRHVIEVGCSWMPTAQDSQKYKKGEEQRRHAMLYLDPAADWRVLKISTTIGDSVQTSFQVSYVPTDGNSARIARSVRRNVYRASVITDTIEFPSWTTTPTSASEFYLPSLGLPDCPDPKQRLRARLLLIGGNLIVIGTVTLFLYYWRRRKHAENRPASGKS